MSFCYVWYEKFIFEINGLGIRWCFGYFCDGFSVFDCFVFDLNGVIVDCVFI